MVVVVMEVMEEGQAGEKGYDAFGVGLRSNAEAYTYGLEMLKRGIPFRSKANFFNDPNTQALLHWLTIADEGAAGDVDRINAAILGARSAPATKLGKKFEDKVSELASGNYLTWLSANWQVIYGRGEWSEMVQLYVANLTKVAALHGLPAEQVLNTILEMQGFDGRTVKDVLFDKVRENEEVLAEIRATSVSGTVSDEDIADVAFAPLAPLKGLLGARPGLTEAMKYVRQLQAANAKLTADDDPDAKGFYEPAVTLGTMHSWKGLEVPRMYIPLLGGQFPRISASEEDLASERRLAYVAVTRGEDHVTIMNIPTARNTKEGTVIYESQFVGEMCLPEASDPESVPRTASLDEEDDTVSYWDEQMLDAYLQSRGA